MREVFDPNKLGEFSLFQGLTATQCARIRRVMYRAVYPSGAHLLVWGQPSEALYILQHGIVKVSIPGRVNVPGADGSEVILGFRGPTEVLGEISLVDGQGCSADVFIQEKATLYCTDSESFASFMEAMPILMRNVAKVVARHARLSAFRSNTEASLRIDSRIAHWLLALGRDFGDTNEQGETTIRMQLTQQELANCVGASRVRVNQAMARFVQAHYISTHDNFYTLHDPESLLKLCGNYPPAK